MNVNRTIAGLLGLAALALPAAAVAKGKPEDAGKGKAKHETRVHKVQYVFRGTWSADGVVVTSGNKHVKRADLVGQTVAFDLTNAKLRVADVNGDGKQDASDLQDGDRVLVQARLPKKDPGTGPFAARKVVDQTHPRSEDDSSETEAPESETPAS
jgi:hypothetical protein